MNSISGTEERSHSRASVLLKVLKTQGPAWAFTRARLALWNQLGILERKTPVQAWREVPLSSVLQPNVPAIAESYCAWRQEHSPAFLFDALSIANAERFVGSRCIAIADRMAEGEFPFFGYSKRLGFPPAWHSGTESRASADGHWSALNEFEAGDIKLAWEPNRFSWAYSLARAYARSRDEKYAETFWTLLKSWIDENPPNKGINWKCGQETSFRAMALCFAFFAFARSGSSTPERVAQFVCAIAVHAKRIDSYIEYAISQKNNHAISEGAGLWTIGLLFPELRHAERWKRRGKRVIETEVRRQIYDDGSYIQHSSNYHRVMMQDLAWAIRLGELNNNRLSSGVYERLGKSVRFLHAITDRTSGFSPNYGANDGALVFPLSDCDYPDMRPALQSCHYIVEHSTLFPPGPWNEEMVWVNGLSSLSEASMSEHLPVDMDAKLGGCFTLHSAESWAMLRGSDFKHRPSQADQLHVDMWWRGENILCDPGTYSYNALPPFDHGYASTRYHNTIAIDGTDQMTRLGRFLWADWATARVQRFETNTAGIKAIEATHDGFRRANVIHRRTLAMVQPDTWIIIDDLVGNAANRFRLHWLTPDVPFELAASGSLRLSFKAGNVHLTLRSTKDPDLDVFRAGHWVAGNSSSFADGSRGWHSRYYAHKEPALSIALDCDSTTPLRFVTVAVLGKELPIELNNSLTRLQIGSTHLCLSPIGVSPVILKI